MVQREDARIRLGWPDVGAAELDEVAGVLESGMLTMGPKVPEFEAELARACEVEHALAVSSGTAALHLAVLALGLEPGDEVIVPAYTFPATANVVALAGLRPVLVDVDPETMNIDPEQIEVGPRTKAVLAVHLFAARSSSPESVPVLEDSASAVPAIAGEVAVRSSDHFTIAWNFLEGLVAVATGLIAGSISLVGFGIDSFVEVTSGSVF